MATCSCCFGPRPIDDRVTSVSGIKPIIVTTPECSTTDKIISLDEAALADALSVLVARGIAGMFTANSGVGITGTGSLTDPYRLYFDAASVTPDSAEALCDKLNDAGCGGLGERPDCCDILDTRLANLTARLTGDEAVISRLGDSSTTLATDVARLKLIARKANTVGNKAQVTTDGISVTCADIQSCFRAGANVDITGGVISVVGVEGGGTALSAKPGGGIEVTGNPSSGYVIGLTTSAADLATLQASVDDLMRRVSNNEADIAALKDAWWALSGRRGDYTRDNLIADGQRLKTDLDALRAALTGPELRRLTDAANTAEGLGAQVAGLRGDLSALKPLDARVTATEAALTQARNQLSAMSGKDAELFTGTPQDPDVASLIAGEFHSLYELEIPAADYDRIGVMGVQVDLTFSGSNLWLKVDSIGSLEQRIGTTSLGVASGDLPGTVAATHQVSVRAGEEFSVMIVGTKGGGGDIGTISWVPDLSHMFVLLMPN